MMKIIDPKYWGPYTWYVIHTMAYSYESDKKVNYERILNSLKDLIPCFNCREFYKQWINKNPYELNNKDSFINWTIALHNAVNQKIGKRNYSRSEVDAIYLEQIRPINPKLFNFNYYQFLSLYLRNYLVRDGAYLPNFKPLIINIIIIYPLIDKRKYLYNFLIFDNINFWEPLKYKQTSDILKKIIDKIIL